MGWNLDAYTLQMRGVTAGGPLEQWNRGMLRFARHEGPDYAVVDPALAAEAVNTALEMLRAVTSVGGQPAFVVGYRSAMDAFINYVGYLGIPVLEPSLTETGFLTGLPPSEERLARLIEWPDLIGLTADEEIASTRRDLARERNVPRQQLSFDLMEQPDIIVVVGDQINPLLLAEAKQVGIPVAATVRHDSDPSQVYWPIPGDFSDEEILQDFASAAHDYAYSGLRRFESRLEKYGDVRLPALHELDWHEEFLTQLRDRLESPHAGIDADDVLASWDR